MWARARLPTDVPNSLLQRLKSLTHASCLRVLASLLKKFGTWLADIDDLPYNVIYVEGKKTKEFIGSGVERLVNRMRRVLADDAAG